MCKSYWTVEQSRNQCNSVCRWRRAKDRDHGHSVPDRWDACQIQYWLFNVHAESSLFVCETGFREGDTWISKQLGCTRRVCSRVSNCNPQLMAACKHTHFSSRILVRTVYFYVFLVFGAQNECRWGMYIPHFSSLHGFQWNILWGLHWKLIYKFNFGCPHLKWSLNKHYKNVHYKNSHDTNMCVIIYVQKNEITLMTSWEL